MIACPTLHPAFLLRSGEGEQGQARFEHVVLEDFKRAVEMLKRVPEWREDVIWQRDQVSGRLINLFPSLEDVFRFCSRAQGKRVAVDVETTGQQPLNCSLICVGFACENGEALCFPVLQQYGRPYWPAQDWQRAWDCVRWLLADPNTRKVFHNGAFDSLVLIAHGAWVNGWTDDTMQAHHCFDGEMPQNLAFVGSRFLEVPFWKNLKSGDLKGDIVWLELPDHELRSYNLRDCLVTIRALPRLLRELEKLELTSLYENEIECVREMMFATLRGLHIDEKRRQETSAKLVAQRDSALAELRAIAGDPLFKPSSPKQLQAQLFGKLRFPVVKHSKSGQPATDKEAMILLAIHAGTLEQKRFLKALVNWRVPDKQISTWVGEWIALPGDGAAGGWRGGFDLINGRLHPSWKLLPVSGRFSSSPNAQNWNTAIKKMFCAPEGRILAGVDLSQAEIRGISYLAGDYDTLLFYDRDANGETVNIHTVNTTLVFGVRCPPEKMKDDSNARTENLLRELVPQVRGVPYESLPVLPPNAWKPARVLSKNGRFGWQYGAMPETLHTVFRTKRDPDTNEQLFPNLTLGEVEAMVTRFAQISAVIPRWWVSISDSTQRAKHYRCPLSGRIRWYRGGFKRNEMLNTPVQTLIASHVNKALPRIGRAIRELSGGSAFPAHPTQLGEAGLICQVHDMLGSEGAERYGQDIGEIYLENLNAPFALPNFPNATLPADKPSIAKYLNEI